jgi:hypothetical protein
MVLQNGTCKAPLLFPASFLGNCGTGSMILLPLSLRPLEELNVNLHLALD